MKFIRVFIALLLGIVLFAAFTAADEQEAPAPAKRPLCPCPRNYEPVCAANQITYPNRCEYNCVRREMERTGRSLTLLRSGPC